VIPDTSYAKTADGANVAYQVIGDGPVDIVYSAGWFSNVDLIWEHPEIEPFFRRLAAGNRLILFDRRGTGLSDPMAELPDLDSILDDLRAVMAAARSDRAVLIGLTIGAAPLAIFAASNPERALGLVLIHAAARTAWAPDYPWGESMEHHREETDRIASGWGTGGFEEWFLRLQGDPRADDAAYVAMTARYLRHSMPRGTAVQHNQPWIELDFRHVLPAVHVPTLVIERRRDLPHGRHLAGLIPGSEYVLLEGEPQLPWVPGGERTAAEIERFIAAIREEEADLGRVLATVLYTDVVDSTGRAAEVGDTRWKEAMDEHNRVVRASLARYRGKEIKTTGDGFLATFDAPARAVRCAQAIVRAVERLGIHIRAGLHTGELNLQGGDISGIAAAIGARIMSIAGPGEVLVSATVKDIVAGSGLSFAERGEHDLKGVPGRWRLYAAVDSG
jgi:class 3 adenylate cyclase